MTTFSDKAQFNLKQMVTAIGIALTVGGGIARFEFKTTTLEAKMNTMIALLDTNKRETNRKFAVIEQRLLANETDLKSVTTSLTAITAFIKPEEIVITRKR